MNDNARLPAFAFPPSEYVLQELEAREWGLSDLSQRSGLSIEILKGIVGRREPITEHIANGLGKAFDTSPQLWINFDNNFRAWLQAQGKVKK